MRRAALGLLAAAALYLAAIAAYGLTRAASPADLAIVFGNTIGPDGRPAPRTRARLDTALALYRAHTVPLILVSGGLEPGGQDEATAMAAYLVAQGVPRAAILQDHAGDTTALTAAHAATLAPGQRAVAVTQWFHLPRALLALHRAGFSRLSGAYPPWAEWRDAYSFLREAAAVPAYALRPPTPNPGP